MQWSPDTEIISVKNMRKVCANYADCASYPHIEVNGVAYNCVNNTWAN